MAVAVKTSPGARSTGLLASPAILSVVGVFYLLACLAIVFKLIPDLWWLAWDNARLGAYTFVGGALLTVICLVVGVLLLVVGARLLGPQPPVGVRAGVFVGFLGLLTVVGLARWASVWIEHWAYTGALGSNPLGTGWIILGVIALGLFLAWFLLFLREGTQKFIVNLEQAGWFQATAYKPNQGQKVRRATIAGLLLLVGAGIYTMVTHNVVGRGSPDLVLNVPFTGLVAVESFGDAQKFLAALDESAKTQVQIRWPGGEGTEFRVGQVVSFKTYREAVEKIVKNDENLAKELPGDAEPTAFLLAVNKRIIGAEMERLLESNFYPEGVSRRLEALFEQTPWEDIGEVIPDFYREAEAVKRGNKDKVIPEAFALPSAVLMLDRFALRNVNEQTDEEKNVKIVLLGDAEFKDENGKKLEVKEGDIVSRDQFDQAVKELKAQIEMGRDRVLPQKGPLAAAYGKAQYASWTLLPSVQFTIPLLLLAASLWLAWRVVNMPTFADFLIATEAELNKVSWTTQKKLVQDTIVVLMTVLLMAVFLFGMDWTWKVVLSWKPIGVLHIPKEQSEKNRPFEQKRW